MKGIDRSIYEISVFYGFRILQALATTISLHEGDMGICGVAVLMFF